MTSTSRCSLLALTALSGLAQGQTLQGPASSATPYLTPVPGGPAIQACSILTTGDSVNLKPDGVSPYVMVGLPDGLGAYDSGEGTMTLLMNHELGSGVGIPRAHGGIGSFVSRWVIDRRATFAGAPNPDFLRVFSGEDLDTSVVTTSAGTGTLTALNRYCSADLAPQTAFFNPASGLGTQERIFLNGEEGGGGGRVIAHVLSERTGYQLPGWTSLNGSWENILANPAPSDSTILAASSDGGDNRVFVYIGTKQASGTTIEKAGLTNGQAFGVQVTVDGANVAAESRPFGFNSSGETRLSARFTLTPGATGTSFSRPEDGAWDVQNPRDFYFVTTDRLDTTDGGSGPANQEGRSRLWRMRFDDLANPAAGGTIEALVDGTGGPDKPNMMDNMTIAHGRNGHTFVIAQEDTGNASHLAKVWLFDVTAGTRQQILQHDQARFGNVGLAPTAPFTYDEESSGVIDAEGVLGKGWFLAVVQDHHAIPGELVEGGQLLAFYLPQVGGLCAADFNGDGFTDLFDYSAYVDCFEGACAAGTNADFNGDGFADFFDYTDFVDAFETGC